MDLRNFIKLARMAKENFQENLHDTRSCASKISLAKLDTIKCDVIRYESILAQLNSIVLVSTVTLNM